MYSLTSSRKKFIVRCLIAFLVFASVLTIIIVNPFQEKLEIAVVSPLSNVEPSQQRMGQNNVDAIKFYLQALNKEGGVGGKKVVLSVYDDQGKPEVARQVSEKIVRSQAIAVIGHTTSLLTISGSKAYEEYNMPVISGTASIDQLTNYKWFFRTIFSNSEQATVMVNFVNKVLKYSKVTLIRGTNIYGTNLGEQLISKFAGLGVEIVHQSLIGDDTKADINRTITTLKSFIQEGKDPGMLIVAMNSEKAAQFIRQLRLADINLPIFGGDTLADFEESQYFDNEPKEQKEKGYFTKNIRALTPIIFDVLDDSGQKFKSDFEKIYGHEPGWRATAFHDGAVGVIESLKKIDTKAKSISDLRSLVIAELKKFNTPDTAFNGAGRLIYFDKNGDNLTPAYVGLYDHQQFVSAFTQLQLVRDLRKVMDLPKKIQSGEILQIGDNYLQKIKIVYAGMDINAVDDIDESSSSYLVDFYLWFRSRNDFSSDGIEFTNYSNTNLNSGEALTLGKPIEEGIDDGINFKVYRMKANFSESFDFRLYPFDRQVLKVKFRNSKLTRDQLIYVVDLVGMRGAKSEQILERAQKEGLFEGISNWTVKKIQFFQNTLFNNSTLGNRQIIDTDSDINYSQFNANVYIQRDVLSFVIKNLLPLLFFIIIAYLITYLPFEQISIEAVSGLLLAVVFYHLNLTDKLPKNVGYTVLLDYAFYIVYFLIGVQLLIIVLGNNELIKSNSIKTEQLMHYGRIAFPIVIGLASILMFWATY